MNKLHVTKSFYLKRFKFGVSYTKHLWCIGFSLWWKNIDTGVSLDVGPLSFFISYV